MAKNCFAPKRLTEIHQKQATTPGIWCGKAHPAGNQYLLLVVCQVTDVENLTIMSRKYDRIVNLLNIVSMPPYCLINSCNGILKVGNIFYTNCQAAINSKNKTLPSIMNLLYYIYRKHTHTQRGNIKVTSQYRVRD